MIAVLKREIKNYLKHPLLWLAVVIVVWGVYSSTEAYLTTHYFEPGEELEAKGQKVYEGEVYEGYVPATPEKHRELWNEAIAQTLEDEFEMTEAEAQAVIASMGKMDIKTACAYLEEEYRFYGAEYVYEDCAYYRGSAEEINAYLDEKLEEHPFSFYYARKFADFAGMYMGFFAVVLLSVLFLQDTRRQTWELLHTKPVSPGSYVLGKAGAGFGVCAIVLLILNLLFWGLCLACTGKSGFEVRLLDFLLDTALYILPNMLMIVCVYTLVSLLFKNPLPAVPALVLYIIYSNMGTRNAEGVYGYYGRPLAIMVRFPGQFFDTAPPPLVLPNQCFLILASVCILLVSVQLWKRRRM